MQLEEIKTFNDLDKFLSERETLEGITPTDIRNAIMEASISLHNLIITSMEDETPQPLPYEEGVCGGIPIVVERNTAARY